MTDDNRDRPSLRDRSADQIRNEQLGGQASPVDPNRDPGPEGNATLRKVWSEPGGEANNYRNATVTGRGGWHNPAGGTGDHDELTAAETPDTHRHLNDATLGPDDKDATAEAIERATAVNGRDPKPR